MQALPLGQQQGYGGATELNTCCWFFKQIPFVFQKIFSEPGSLSMATITRLRESCRARLLAQG